MIDSNIDTKATYCRINAFGNTSVIGIRYELNDPYICVIAKLINNTNNQFGVDKQIKIKKTKIKLI